MNMSNKKTSFVPVWKQLLNRATELHGDLKLSDPIVAKIVEGYESRFINYVYGIKKCAKLDCIPVRQGKKVIGYQIPALAALAPSVPVAEETPASSDAAVSDAPVESDAIAASLS